LSSFFIAGRDFSPALRPYVIGPMHSPDIQNLLEAFASTVQTPGYVPKKKPGGFFWVHPPKKPTPKKPALLL